MDIEEFYD
jgi:hypothetical protein